MKKVKKLASLLLAMVMVLSMSFTALADDTAQHTITITNTKSGHTYEAYQVFKCDFSDNKMTNIQWGAGVNSAALLTALQADATIGNLFTNVTDANDVAEVIAADTFTDEMVDTFSEIVAANLSATVAGTSTATTATTGSTYEIKVTGDGYYFVKDKDASVAAGDAYTRYILRVLGDVTVAAKAEAPGLIKKIVAGNKESDASTGDIGGTVNYKLTSKVPDMDGYQKYYFIVHDTMSEGLTFDPDSVDVKINGTSLAKTAYTVSVSTASAPLTDGCTFEIVMNDFIQYKAQKGQAIEITYSAIINENAEIGTVGNTNKVKLQYSNNPNVDPKPDPTNPDRPDPSNPTPPTGETPEDVVVTYLTEIQLTKVEKGNTAKTLQGAKFRIGGVSSKVVVINKEMFVEDAAGTYYRLKDGKYTTVAPTNDNTDSYDDTTKKYKKVEVVDKTTVSQDFTTEGWVNDQGVITFTGLGEGTYTITELVAPDGYNKLNKEITVIVSSNAGEITYPDKASEFAWSATVDGEAATIDNGIIKFNVENTAGIQLPETGGIGTTIFYIVGGILVIGAIVLLITRKRMSMED